MIQLEEGQSQRHIKSMERRSIQNSTTSLFPIPILDSNLRIIY